MSAAAVRLLALVFLAVAAVLPGQPSRAAQARSVQDALARVVADGDYQQALPAPDAPDSSSDSGPGLPIVELLLRVLGVALLVGVAAAAIVMVLRSIQRRPDLRPAAAHRDAPPAPTPVPAVADLDARVRAGDLDDAIRDLLHRVLAWLVAREPALRPTSLTSREVLAAARLPAPAAAALRELVDAVERAVFAGRPAAPDDWDRCRAAYTRLEAAFGGDP
ncbi:MAG: DUF4129 domain-containing protein [Myxococcota bacterium]